MNLSIEQEAKAILQAEEKARLDAAVQAVAERRERERQAAERKAQLAEIRQRIPAELDRAPLEEAIAVFRAGAETLIAACAAHDARHADLWMAINGLASSGPVPADLVAAHTYGGLISADGKDYRKSRVQHTMATVLYEVFRQYYPREGWDIGKPQD